MWLCGQVCLPRLISGSELVLEIESLLVPGIELRAFILSYISGPFLFFIFLILRFSKSSHCPEQA